MSEMLSKESRYNNSMKETIAQFLNIKDFPFQIKDENGNEIYYECSDRYWIKREYISNGKEIYIENSHGYWTKREYDSNGNVIYSENSYGYWGKREYDSNGKEIYYEDSEGFIHDSRPKPVVEMTLQEIADKVGVDVKSIRIKE
jgi:hypothetical protein